MLLEDISAAFSGDRLKTEEPWRHGGCLMLRWRWHRVGGAGMVELIAWTVLKLKMHSQKSDKDLWGGSKDRLQLH